MDTKIKHTKARTIFGIVGVLTTLQLALFCIKRLIFVFVERTDYSDHVSTMFAMAILATLFGCVEKRVLCLQDGIIEKKCCRGDKDENRTGRNGKRGAAGAREAHISASKNAIGF